MHISKKTAFLSVGFAAIVVALLTVSCTMSKEGGTEDKVSLEEAVPVEVQAVERTTLTETMLTVGTVEAWHDVTVSAEGAGKVVEVRSDEGDPVERGDVIVRLDDELNALGVAQADAQVAMARANYRKAKRDLKRSEELFGTKDISESQIEMARLGVETAEAGLRSAEVALQMARRQLADTKVKSPISGKVAERYVDIGEMVSPGMPVATVIDLRRIRVEVTVSEEEIAQIEEGQRAYLTVDAYPDERFEGKVSMVGLKADRQTRSFPVDIEVPDNTGEKLKSGMIARAEIEVKTYSDVLLILQDAILEGTGEKIVYVIESNRAAKRPLTLGRRWDERVVVESGLEEGDRLVVAGQENLSEGAKVRVE